MEVAAGRTGNVTKIFMVAPQHGTTSSQPSSSVTKITACELLPLFEAHG